MYFYPDFSKNLKKKREGVFLNTLTGEKIQMTYIRLSPGESTNHAHTNEQSGYILKGKVEITINGEKNICKAGDAYIIPSNVSHGFRVPDDGDVEYLEIFSPPKEENEKTGETN